MRRDEKFKYVLENSPHQIIPLMDKGLNFIGLLLRGERRAKLCRKFDISH